MPYNTRQRTKAAAAALSELERVGGEVLPSSPKRIKRDGATPTSDNIKAKVMAKRVRRKGILQELPNMPLDILDEVGYILRLDFNPGTETFTLQQ